MKKISDKILAALIAAAMLCAASCSDNKKDSSSAENSDPAPGSMEFVTDPDEPELGEYTVSEKGTKLYYNPDEISPELMGALEKYFTCYAETDYESYEKFVQEDYLAEMNKYLERDYGYTMETSFANQCENLKTNAGGDFKITRIKAELPAESGIDSYFQTLDEVFETDFTGTIKNKYDTLHDLIFYIMAEAEGEETLLISEFEIVFAEENGEFFYFG